MKKILVSLCLTLATMTVSAKTYSVSSPNGLITVNVCTDNQLQWDIRKDNTVILQPSAIGLKTDIMDFGQNVKVKKTRSSNVRKSSGNYGLLQMVCNGLIVEFRVFNDAAAYRIVPTKPLAKVVNETAEFRFAADYEAFIPYVNDNRAGERWCYSFESYYDRQRLSQMFADSLAITPTAICLPEKRKAVVMEADVENYPGMYLKKGKGNSLQAAFPPLPLEEEIGGYNRLNLVPTQRAEHIAENVSRLPWRIVVISDSDRELLGNDIARRLGPVCRLTDTSWIKPGKVAWDWWNNTNLTGVDFRAGINTETYKYFIDFARKNKLEYIIIDEGWSDPEDLLLFSDKMDMAGIIDYARQQGVGVILWSSWRNLIQRGHEKMEEIMKHYGDMGVKGFKVDFMDRDDQECVRFYYKMAETAAKYHLIVDFHGAYKPTGMCRTYPNVLNFEGVYGLENTKWDGSTEQVEYEVTIPFIRMVAGFLDYTQGAMVNASRNDYRAVYSSPMSQGTRCRQLAQYVIYESPLNMMCDSPSNYIENEECTNMIASVPTVWEKTVALDGKVGEYAAIARFADGKWYIGAITDWEERTITIDLSGLSVNAERCTAFLDGANAGRNGEDYIRREIPIIDNTITVSMKQGGGALIVIESK